MLMVWMAQPENAGMLRMARKAPEPKQETLKLIGVLGLPAERVALKYRQPLHDIG